MYTGCESAAYDTKTGAAYVYGALQFTGWKFGEALKSGDVIDVTYDSSKPWLSFGTPTPTALLLAGKNGKEWGWIPNYISLVPMFPFVTLTGSGSSVTILDRTHQYKSLLT